MSARKQAAYSESERSLPIVGRCFSGLERFLLSFRLAAGTVPMAVRDMAFTALVARNGLGFFFFGTVQEFNRKGRKGRNV
jgi:hypothetical protein